MKTFTKEATSKWHLLSAGLQFLAGTSFSSNISNYEHEPRLCLHCTSLLAEHEPKLCLHCSHSTELFPRKSYPQRGVAQEKKKEMRKKEKRKGKQTDKKEEENKQGKRFRCKMNKSPSYFAGLIRQMMFGWLKNKWFISLTCTQICKCKDSKDHLVNKAKS